ncbi:MarR family transcriptional regulator [Caloramator sp. E03]|uniref:MarR family winged helix-turn-helix transcriptional regulator n=1 Tax=Caloramator sp. E03 TaxID=2576307 RepID=UPI0011100863|nr:MarR family transcriptional regulator [Caloramator sp. E03]QCX34711.1 MarR family transcriptional regulator [Caloramator sp. E03]
MKDNLLDIREGTLHISLMKLIKAHRQRATEEFGKIGLTKGQPKILDYLSKNNGCIQRELAENCHIEPATVTSLLSNMEKANLIYRIANSKDRRVYNVFLTEKGMEVQKQVERIFYLIDEECFYGFSEEERKEAIDILNRL